MAKQYYYANGKRKTAVARVRLHEKGSGEITINDKPIKDWVDAPEQMQKIVSPLDLTGHKKDFDVTIRVGGG